MSVFICVSENVDYQMPSGFFETVFPAVRSGLAAHDDRLLKCCESFDDGLDMIEFEELNAEEFRTVLEILRASLEEFKRSPNRADAMKSTIEAWLNVVEMMEADPRCSK